MVIPLQQILTATDISGVRIVFLSSEGSATVSRHQTLRSLTCKLQRFLVWDFRAYFVFTFCLNIRWKFPKLCVNFFNLKNVKLKPPEWAKLFQERESIKWYEV